MDLKPSLSIGYLESLQEVELDGLMVTIDSENPSGAELNVSSLTDLFGLPIVFRGTADPEGANGGICKVGRKRPGKPELSKREGRYGKLAK